MDLKQVRSSQTEDQRTDELLARVLYCLTFLILFVVAVSASVVGLKWRSWLPGAEHFTSLSEGVRAATNSVVPFMFTE